ncbi:pentatricopeptide repeat-containing protein At4g04370 isoform X1 [Nymphaea colorata]|uniref:pentatricopeptide repeat-containing protein At4g04370 isoform X1 n=1 Tax=Nymphaea colorata TaxID=210225 RepID=UPI00129EA752|nr:pentatricopeptide repeat-containing protein At4g04370 isoform X1 [Nymphaea colorata]XP_031500579.1 pentatricopeptide repeat-containing protein At4g04370 isoform X1 [Nymphaea colorata]XP_031500580.1 pentatricopeptide repeat-containing protein At4g04370 isoform X1 [Nymphaea colorata]XP_031500581.1 pentatricopeptide repeat-containing protein At4g04370 isoform X1 [Nymphaea colorata]XP_031500582.1 pentatricopeptide repeat-containing protein At4g04370 isoform X1 [Nymphaea colorata]
MLSPCNEMRAIRYKIAFSLPAPRCLFLPYTYRAIATNTTAVSTIHHDPSFVDTHHQSLLTYSSMFREGVPISFQSYPSLLKACATLGSLDFGRMVHHNIVKMGFSSDVYIGASLIDMYAKLGEINDAHHAFVELPERSVVPWTAIITGYSQNGDINMAFSMCNMMRFEGMQPNSVTMLTLLAGIDLLVHLVCVHGSIIKFGVESDIRVANSLVNVYTRCGSLESGERVFYGMAERDIVSWNTMISGHSQYGNVEVAVDLLQHMQLFGGAKPDFQTLGSLASGIANEGLLALGKSIHALIVSYGFESDVIIQTALMGMYSKCGSLDDAMLLFENARHRDDVSWMTIISGLVLNDRADESLTIFAQMFQARYIPSTAIIACAIAACSQLCALDKGTSIHAYLIRNHTDIDIAAGNSLVTMYAKCRRLELAWRVFERMNERDVVSWNAIVSGHTQTGQLDKALLLFAKMKLTDQRPDLVTMVGLLQACAACGALHQGKWIHGFILRHNLEASLLMDTALVDMYCKSGDIDTAMKCFNQMPQKDVVSWSTIIAGCGSHGKGKLSLSLYLEMLESGIQPNNVTFLALLSACSHAGLVFEGLRLYKSMVDDHRLKPKMEHSACIIDLLSRAGKVNDAYKFINSGGISCTTDMLGILLTNSKNHGNVGLSKDITEEIVAKEPETAENFVQLAQSYAAISNWEGMAQMWVRMKSLGLKKSPGWSYIESQGIINTFFAGDFSHACSDDIKTILCVLNMEMREECQCRISRSEAYSS